MSRFCSKKRHDNFWTVEPNLRICLPVWSIRKRVGVGGAGSRRMEKGKRQKRGVENEREAVMYTK